MTLMLIIDTFNSTRLVKRMQDTGTNFVTSVFIQYMQYIKCDQAPLNEALCREYQKLEL